MRRDEAYLLDIVLAARKALQFVQGVSREQFEQNELIQNAVLRPLEVIGEAAGRVAEATRSKHPEIPWEQMVGLRNRLIHEYFRVDYGTVWDTIHNDLPSLIRQLEPLIPPEDEI
jgi:uncharacterized protein with HEPN domain